MLLEALDSDQIEEKIDQDLVKVTIYPFEIMSTFSNFSTPLPKVHRQNFKSLKIKDFDLKGKILHPIVRTQNWCLSLISIRVCKLA